MQIWCTWIPYECIVLSSTQRIPEVYLEVALYPWISLLQKRRDLLHLLLKSVRVKTLLLVCLVIYIKNR
jgi:hypothetical protein